MKVSVQEFVFNEPPTPECHASTLLKRRDGGILTAWFAGTRESESDVTIFSSIRIDGQWSTPRRITVSTGEAQWNPVLFRISEDTIALYYKQGNPPIAEWRTMVSYSHDEGETWSEAAELVPGDTSGGRGPVKNKAIRLSDGAIAAPASTEQGPWRPFLDISEDDGRTWTKAMMPVTEEGLDLIQPTLWEYPKGSVHALLRTNREHIYRSDSGDLGRTWSPVYATEIPNNNSGIDLATAEDGTIALLCNPVPKNWGPRTPLSIYVSEDHGASFRHAAELETYEDGELSYPAIIADGKRFLCTYTWNRKKVRYCEFTVD